MTIGRRDVSGARAIQPIAENCAVAAVRFEMCLACFSARPTLQGKLHEHLVAGVGLIFLRLVDRDCPPLHDPADNNGRNVP